MCVISASTTQAPVALAAEDSGKDQVPAQKVITDPVAIKEEPKEQALANKNFDFAALSDDQYNVLVRCGVTAAVLGFLFGGPLLSQIFGALAAYASQKNDRVGGYVRALGNMGVRVKDRSIAIDNRLHLTKRASDAWAGVKGKYGILDKLAAMFLGLWLWFVKVVTERHMVEKRIELAGRGYEYVAKKIGGSGKSCITAEENQKKED